VIYPTEGREVELPDRPGVKLRRTVMMILWRRKKGESGHRSVAR